MVDQTIDLTEIGDPLGQAVTVSVASGPHAGLCYTFSHSGEVVFGRGVAAHIRLPREPAMSQAHFKLVLLGTSVSFEDLQSRNGLKLNGMRVTAGTLEDGDQISVGETTVEIKIQSNEEGTRHVVSPREPERAPPTVNELSADTVYAVPLYQADATHELPPPSSPGRLDSHLREIGPYELLEEIGRGGMGVVYRAQHKKSGHLRAVKVILSNAGFTEKSKSLFFREATVMLRLRHSGIVRAFELGTSHDVPFLVMELLEPECIEQVVGALAYERRIRVASWIVYRVLEALSYAHALGVVHRDVKPRNIIGFRTGRRLNVKLGDFGLAKFFNDSEISSLTDDCSVRGTLSYMAPEQLSHAKSSAPAVDIYSAGACLFRLVTGEPPPLVCQDEARLMEVLMRERIPQPLVDAIIRSLQFHPGNRFATAAEFSAAIVPFTKK